MARPYTIGAVITADDLRATARLFEAYARSLPIDLGYQDFAAELASLPGKYAPPGGALLLARGTAGQALGCVGLRPLEAEGCCEMKRLYIDPEARGTGLGRALAQAVVQQARAVGYRQLRLDTLATMTAAIGLYRQMGFIDIAPYYAPTPPGTIFLGLDL